MKNFNIPIEERCMLIQLAKRANTELKMDFVDTFIMLGSIHANGSRLNLSKLLNATKDEFINEMHYLSINYDKKTGHIINGFIPKFAA